jgi:hypothetical protein
VGKITFVGKIAKRVGKIAPAIEILPTPTTIITSFYDMMMPKYSLPKERAWTINQDVVT